MAWSWVGAQLSGMAAGEFKLLNTNRPLDVALARTRANFDAGAKFADDAAVVAAIKDDVYAFSGEAINGDTGVIIKRGGGHSDGGDGSVFRFNTATLAWELYLKSPRYESTAPTVTCNVTAITAGTPPRLTVDADIVISGDQGVVSGTTDADGTYQLVRVSATEVDLYNVDGSSSAQFTAFAGGALTNSSGTLTITWNPQSSTTNYYAHTNADGEQMPPIPHTYHHDRWVGGNKYVLGGDSVFDGNGGQAVGRLWFLDEDASPKVYRGYHDTRTGNGLYLTNTSAAGRQCGPVAYNPWDGRLYTGDGTATIFGYRAYRWSSDFLLKSTIESDGGVFYPNLYDGLVLPQPGDLTKRMFLVVVSSTAWTGCTDIEAGGTPLQASHNFASALFTTGMVGVDVQGHCWDDTNGTVVYWGGGGTIGEILVDADLDAWDTQEVTPATPTGDVPVSTGATHNCSIVKVPDYDAYMLAQGGNVYLYARTDIAAGGGGSEAALTGSAVTGSAGSLGVTRSKALSGSSSTSAVGTLSPALSRALSGEEAAGAQGSLTNAVSIALSGSELTFAQGSLTATVQGSAVLSGQAASFGQGTLSPQVSVGLTGEAITSAQGDVEATSGVIVALSGEAATFAQGDLSAALSALLEGEGITAEAGSVALPSQHVAGGHYWPTKHKRPKDYRREIDERRLEEKRELRQLIEQAAGVLEQAEEIADPPIAAIYTAPRPEFGEQVAGLRAELDQLGAYVEGFDPEVDDPEIELDGPRRLVESIVARATDDLVQRVAGILTDLIQEIIEESEADYADGTDEGRARAA